MRYPTSEQLARVTRYPGEDVGDWYVGICVPVGDDFAAEYYGPLDKGSAMRLRKLWARLNPNATRVWLERIPDEELAD